VMDALELVAKVSGNKSNVANVKLTVW
jgi:hypothetical protein